MVVFNWAGRLIHLQTKGAKMLNSSGMKKSFVWISAIAVLIVSAGKCSADEPPPGSTSIGGRWFIGPSENPIYYYHDGDRYVDLFSLPYHRLE